MCTLGFTAVGLLCPQRREIDGGPLWPSTARLLVETEATIKARSSWDSGRSPPNGYGLRAEVDLRLLEVTASAYVPKELVSDALFFDHTRIPAAFLRRRVMHRRLNPRWPWRADSGRGPSLARDTDCSRAKPAEFVAWASRSMGLNDKDEGRDTGTLHIDDVDWSTSLHMFLMVGGLGGVGVLAGSSINAEDDLITSDSVDLRAELTEVVVDVEVSPSEHGGSDIGRRSDAYVPVERRVFMGTISPIMPTKLRDVHVEARRAPPGAFLIEFWRREDAAAAIATARTGRST